MNELLDPLKNPTIVAAPFFVLTLLMELAAFKFLETDEEMRGYEAKDARTSIIMGFGSLVSSAAFKAGTLVAYVAVSVYIAPWHLPTDTWWYWVVLVLGLDLSFYLNHRFVHRVRIGWAAHQAHHSSEYFNFSTALRQKWNPWAEAIFWLPFPLLGFAPWTLYVAFSFNLIYQFFTHTERIGTLWKPIELVMNTPSHHRVHHGVNPQYIDRNHGGILIVWDRLFGTFEREDETVVYGLTTNINTFNPLRVAGREYADMFRDVADSTTWSDRLSFVLRGPGWAYDRHRNDAALAPGAAAPLAEELPKQIAEPELAITAS